MRDKEFSTNGKYYIGAVAKLTGLSADVVRVWERRYKAISPSRTSAGTRLYSDEDIYRLRRLRQAMEKGHSIGRVARLSEAELDAVINESAARTETADPYQVTRERFLEAIERMDVVAADLELSRAATLYPARSLVKQIVAPILDEVGDRWSHKELGVAHEHLASWLLRSLLSSLFRLYPPTENAESIVLATPSGERHEFGLLLAALLAATRGWRVIYLGPDLPAAEIGFTLRLTKVRYLALSLVGEITEIEDELRAIADQVPAAVRVWIGGANALNHRELIHKQGWILIRDLDDLDDRLRR
jgi:DNA-binding transcriptional MerR regulator